MRAFFDLTEEQQEKAVRHHEIQFRAALNRGSISFWGSEPRDREATIADLARAMAEDDSYSERDLRTYLSHRSAENAR